MAVFTVTAVGTSDLTYEAPQFLLSPTSMYLLLACPYILLSTLFSDMILISTLLLFMFFSVAPQHKSGLDHRVFEVSRSHTHTRARARARAHARTHAR